MSSKMPPVPPANRSPKGSGSEPDVVRDEKPHGRQPHDPDKQGQQANTKQNTTNQGYQQDR